jgi:hypothetical protein
MGYIKALKKRYKIMIKKLITRERDTGPTLAWLKLAVFAAMCAILCSCGPKEEGGGPIVDGHPLDHWLLIMVDKSQYDRMPQAERAVRRLGTNAIPYCLATLSVGEQAKATASLDKRRSAELLSEGACKALLTLGSQVKPALPNLTKLAHSADPGTVSLSAAVLADLGGDGVAAMVTGITNPSIAARVAIVNKLSFCGTNLLPHVAFLLDNLGGLDRSSSSSCCIALATDLESVTNLTLSFVPLLHSSDPFVRYGAIEGLSVLGTNAIQAVALPALRELRTDSDELNAEAAKQALWAISGKDE